MIWDTIIMTESPLLFTLTHIVAQYYQYIKILCTYVNV